MSIIKNIIHFFKSISYKQKDIKLLEAPEQVVHIGSQSNFINSLRTTIPEKNNKKIETLVLDGNGLGIQKR